jgi:FkbM family methyltransferase
MKYFDKIIKVTEKTHEYRGSFENNEVYSKELLELVLNELNKFNNPILIDVGACTGSYSLLDLILPTLQVYSFEPSRAYIELIENINLNNSKTIAHKKAISNVIGTEIFNEVEFDGCIALSMLGGVPAWHKKTIQKEVEVITIDYFCEQNNIIPNVIKIDTEGNEINVLKGCLKTIEKYKPIIFSEYSEENLNQYGNSLGSIDEFFNQINYKTIILNSGDIIGKPTI